MNTKLVTVALWIAAFLLTVLLAVFQRTTGPSYPLRGEASGAGVEPFRYALPRSHGGPGGLEVDLEVPAGVAGGVLEWRRYPTDDPWTAEVMSRGADGRLRAEVPHQPPAGKVEYRLLLAAGDGATLAVPAGEPPVARFRADVPAGVLIPHILAMFSSMLLATGALLEALRSSTPDPRRTVVLAMGLLVVGGLFLGPVVQKHAFDAYWTGWPLGHDLTDNKTLVAFLAWLPATILALTGRRLRAAVVIGWVVMMGIFLIPHSLRGSERDWEAGEIKTGAAVVTGVGPRAA
ncbi:MAG TPA: hypothetical protein VLB51_12400 [Methylomirabilota bacterium]|nr:hypothetical protein [Methylomirabilota bacterium]